MTKLGFDREKELKVMLRTSAVLIVMFLNLISPERICARTSDPSSAMPFSDATRQGIGQPATEPGLVAADKPTVKADQQLKPDQNKDPASDNAQVAPTTDDDPNFSVLLGVGSLIVSSKATNYVIQNNTTIQEQSIGRATPQLMTGLSFALPFGRPNSWRSGDEDSKHPHPWYAFVSLKFAPGSSDALDGYVIGSSYRLAKYMDVLMGFALNPSHEPSPGFRTIAAQAVLSNPTLSAYQPYVGTTAALLANKADSFDGFPILKQTAGNTQANLFGGNPLVTHYRGGFIVGVAFPIKFRTTLGSGAANTDTAQKGSPVKAK